LARQPEERVVIAAHQTMLAPPALPYDAEVEYLESTGTQYVDTGVHLNASSEFSARLSVTASGTQFIFGVYANTNNQFATASASSGKWIFDCGMNRVSSSTAVQVGSIISMEAKNRTLYIDGVSQGTSSATPGLTGATALLFGWDRTALDGTKQGGKVRIYSASVTGADGARDFVPVRVGQVGYLYDRVSGTLFGNAGTGAFTIGPDK
jgi:hypothetical protein